VGPLSDAGPPTGFPSKGGVPAPAPGIARALAQADAPVFTASKFGNVVVVPEPGTALLLGGGLLALAAVRRRRGGIPLV
jgi:hypothetical protein